MTRRVRVEGVRRKQFDADKYAQALWWIAKAEVEAKRERKAADKEANHRRESRDER